MSEVTQETGNQTVESQEVEVDADTEALYASFGIPKQGETKEIEFPTMEEPTDSLTTEEQEVETKAETQPEKRTFKVKYNGEEKEVDESEAPTLIQKGMNYEKVQGKVSEYQKALDELAQLQGYKDHEDLLSNLPKLREQRQQKEQEEYQELRESLRQEFLDAGLDPDKADAYLDNHPLIKKAQAEVAKSEEREKLDQQERLKQEHINKWNALYQAFPELTESAQAFTRGQEPEWYTAEMKLRIEKGYDPIDAYKLAHSDKLSAQTKKATEQKIIKQQQLGNRAHIDPNTATPPDEASLLPAQIMLAEEFGVDLKGVQRQAQFLKNRR